MSSLIFKNIPESQWGNLNEEDLCLDEQRRIFWGTNSSEQEGFYVQEPDGSITPVIGTGPPGPPGPPGNGGGTEIFNVTTVSSPVSLEDDTSFVGLYGEIDATILTNVEIDFVLPKAVKGKTVEFKISTVEFDDYMGSFILRFDVQTGDTLTILNSTGVNNVNPIDLPLGLLNTSQNRAEILKFVATDNDTWLFWDFFITVEP
jgi:hypothetical protein